MSRLRLRGDRRLSTQRSLYAGAQWYRGVRDFASMSMTRVDVVCDAETRHQARLVIVREGVCPWRQRDRTDPAYSLRRLLIPPLETP